MKALFMSNCYISGVQTGLQAGHCIDSMWSKYVEDWLETDGKASPQLGTLREFSRKHRTFVILNGGGHESLMHWIMFFMACGSEGAAAPHSYPWIGVQEPGLREAYTSVGIILPDRMFGPNAERNAQLWRQYGSHTAMAEAGKSLIAPEDGSTYSDFDLELLVRKMTCGKAT